MRLEQTESTQEVFEVAELPAPVPHAATLEIAPVGNRAYDDPKQLWEAACRYFQWCKDNPIYSVRCMVADKVVQEVKIPKPRPYTIHALCAYIGINRHTFQRYRNKYPDLQHVIELIDDIMYTQKFEYAATEIFNPMIIARDLGLADKRELKGTIEDQRTIDTSKLSDEAMEQLLEAMDSEPARPEQE